MKKYEIFEYENPGYQQVFKFNNWKIAMLNYIDELDYENLSYFESHNETDEAFILLEGSCRMLILSESDSKDVIIESVHLEKNMVFIVKKDVYHTHILSYGTKVLIVEEADTGSENSKKIYITDEIREKIRLRIGDSDES